MLRPVAGRLQSKSTAVRKAIQHDTAFAETPDEAMLLTLIEEEARLVRIVPIEAMKKSVDLQPARL
jgi:hypothetical protein